MLVSHHPKGPIHEITSLSGEIHQNGDKCLIDHALPLSNT